MTETRKLLPAVGCACWRVCPSGTQMAFLNRWNNDGTASINTPGQKHKWSLRATTVPAEDLFVDRSQARMEFRRRKNR